MPNPAMSGATGTTALGWLADVLGLFPDANLTMDQMHLVRPGCVPEPYKTLLVHEHHMTVTLERHHGSPVALETLLVRHDGDDYARKLLLRAGPGGPIVMAGIMRIWLRHVSDDVRSAIVGQREPLGRILIAHDVLRRIETVAFLRVHLGSTIGRVFGYAPEDVRGGSTYGRIAVLFCDGEPAVELFEVVAPCDDATVRGVPLDLEFPPPVNGGVDGFGC